MSSLEDSPLFITALSKGLSIITAFKAGRPSMSLVELAEVTGLNKSTVQRSAFTLEALGYLHKDPVTKRFRLAPKSLDLGAGYLQTSELIERANPYLHELNRDVEESCNLLEPCGLDMLYVARFPSHKQISIHMPLGRHLPMYCTAAGRAYLAVLPRAEADEILRASELRSYTSNTVTQLESLQTIVAEARSDGYAYAREEYFAGDISVAAAVVNADGYPLGSVGISVPISRWSLEDARKYLAPKVINTARTIASATRSLRPVS
ncbi:IclR family transcriptional regulator [Pseudomonas sp. TTU2014-080ASC]|uniref:IclR family transcriptional regulator n=1 Tax=Pseudomonas sp. TTU2014-080ASC TaxID=1729724 RepID=UPI00071894C8|nr:IclR family transcriptional regulator [Pseudomonas sp. TTU2014-080ASC]KRW57803.1 IclR family transcriptional regulator [Pseudomonas sp. TTU2014-080ASC]